MVKLKLIGLLFIISLGYSFAQGKHYDSLKIALQQTLEPIERFAVLNEMIFGGIQYTGHIVDSAICMQMLPIAQQLKNDSLLAIAWGSVEGGDQ